MCFGKPSRRLQVPRLETGAEAAGKQRMREKRSVARGITEAEC